MKNTKFNRLLMVLLMSVTAGSMKASNMVSTDVLPVGYESLYDVVGTDNGLQYRVTQQDKPHLRADAAPIQFTLEAPAVAIVGEDADAPLMGQIDVAMEKLRSMKREEDAKNLARVVYDLEMANHAIQSLPILESDKKEYDRAVVEAERQLKKAEHAYRKATHNHRN